MLRGPSVWENVHIRHSTTIGEQCIVGEKTYIAFGVRIGNRVKTNARVWSRYSADMVQALGRMEGEESAIEHNQESAEGGIPLRDGRRKSGASHGP